MAAHFDPGRVRIASAYGLRNTAMLDTRLSAALEIVPAGFELLNTKYDKYV